MTTLDLAMKAFSENPNHATACQLLAIGRDYWGDEMISDETFDVEIVRTIIEYLNVISQSRAA